MAIFLQPLAEGSAGDVERSGSLRRVAGVLLEDTTDMPPDSFIEVVGNVVVGARHFTA